MADPGISKNRRGRILRVWSFFWCPLHECKHWKTATIKVYACYTVTIYKYNPPKMSKRGTRARCAGAGSAFDVNIVGQGLLPGASCLLVGRSIYRAISAMTRSLDIHGLLQHHLVASNDKLDNLYRGTEDLFLLTKIMKINKYNPDPDTITKQRKEECKRLLSLPLHKK